MAKAKKESGAKEKKDYAIKDATPPMDETKVKELMKKMNIPADVQAKLKDLKKNLDTFKDKVIERFEGYVLGITVLPPQKAKLPKEDPIQNSESNKAESKTTVVTEEEDEDKINVLLLVEDGDSKKMSKEQLKEKLSGIITQQAKEIDENFNPIIVLVSELWQSCYDGKSEYLEMIALGAPIYDMGMLAAIKISEVHKTMILKKFEKYIVSYVLAGSLVQGKATPESDIDVFVVIDDTDVKKMSRTELRDKLRAIIIGMGAEAGEMTGIRNKINIQVYILTDFWNSIKEANPVIFTFLRDGIPFYDRGIFMPWKQLLKMGKIQPSKESIEMYKGTGEQILKRVHMKLNEIGMEDTFYSMLTPSQAAIMLYGYPPPTPKEAGGMMREIFVKKEKLLEEKYIKMLEKSIKIRKDLEHGSKKNLTGQEVGELLTNAEEYTKRMEKLFNEIESRKSKEIVVNMYEGTVTILRDALKSEGIEEVKDSEIQKQFDKHLVHSGKVPEKYSRLLKEIFKAKKDFDENKLTDREVEIARKSSIDMTRFMIDFIQRKKLHIIDRLKLRVQYKKDQLGEAILLNDVVFAVKNITSDKKEIFKAALKKSGALGEFEKSSFEEYETALENLKLPVKATLKQKTFEELKILFGSDMEVLLSF